MMFSLDVGPAAVVAARGFSSDSDLNLPFWPSELLLKLLSWDCRVSRQAYKSDTI